MAEKKTKSGRWKIQLMAAAASNPFFFRFFQGTLYRGPLKRVCVPGLNCYSCPAAAGSCPLGALLGVIVLAVFFYRPFCKWICPLGAFYALFNKISLYRFTIDAQACTACGMCSQACGHGCGCISSSKSCRMHSVRRLYSCLPASCHSQNVRPADQDNTRRSTNETHQKRDSGRSSGTGADCLLHLPMTNW